MLDYQKKVGKKHRISPRSGRTRSQQKDKDGSVPNYEVDKASTTMAANEPNIGDLQPMDRLEKLMNDMCKSMKEVQGQITCIQSDVVQIKKLQTEHYEDLDRKLIACQQENEDLKSQLSTAVDRIDTLEQCYGSTYAQREKEKNEKKALNLIIRGVPENDREKMHETMNDLLAQLNTNEVIYTQTNGAIRMGAKPKNQAGGKQKGPQPRPIKLYCATRLQKGVLYRGLKDIRKIPKYAKVTMNNDWDNDSMIVRKEVQAIYNKAKQIDGIQLKMKGEAIEIDGKTYTREHFQNLPHGLTLENASTVQTPDGVAFQGHGSPASSLYQCELEDGDRTYTCVEQQFVYYMALECKDYVAAANVLCESNPYTILSIGKAIKKTREWSDCEVNVLKECHREKLEQNPEIKRKLEVYGKVKFYEATFNRTYGAGFRLEEAKEGTANPPQGFRNELGIIIEELLQ